MKRPRKRRGDRSDLRAWPPPPPPMGLLKKPRNEMIEAGEGEGELEATLHAHTVGQEHRPSAHQRRSKKQLLGPVKASDRHCNRCWRTRRRGGRRFPTVTRARSPSQSTRTTASQRCSCAGSSWSRETRSSLTRKGLLPAVRTYPLIFVCETLIFPFKTATSPPHLQLYSSPLCLSSSYILFYLISWLSVFPF